MKIKAIVCSRSTSRQQLFDKCKASGACEETISNNKLSKPDQNATILHKCAFKVSSKDSLRVSSRNATQNARTVSDAPSVITQFTNRTDIASSTVTVKPAGCADSAACNPQRNCHKIIVLCFISLLCFG